MSVPDDKRIPCGIAAASLFTDSYRVFYEGEEKTLRSTDIVPKSEKVYLIGCIIFFLEKVSQARK
jgi:hypothetical protein